MSPLASSASMKALRPRASAGSVQNQPASAAHRDSQEHSLAVPSEPQSEWSTKRSRIPSFFARSRKKSTGEAISDTDSPLSSAGANRDAGEGRPSIAPSIDTRSLHPTQPDEQPASHSRRILHLLSTKRTHRKDKPPHEPPPDLPGPSSARPAERRAPQPSITVSLSPDNLHEYQDLFTRPSAEESYPTPTPSPSTTSRSGSHASEDDSVTPRQSNDLQSRAPSLIDPDSASSSTSASARRPAAKRRLRPADAGDYSDSGVESSPATPSGHRASPRDSAYKRRTWGSALSADESSSITTARRHRGSTALPRSTPPPNMPLPAPPPSRSTGPSSAASPRSSSSSNTTSSSPRPFPAPDNLDIESASAADLREALVRQNRRYDELVSHLRQVIDAHTAEKAALEKKVSSLTREVSRKDREIKGLTWVIVNGPGSANDSPTAPRTPSTPRSPTARSPSPTSLSSKHSRAARLRVREENDSGAESYATSGTESRVDSAWEGPTRAESTTSSTPGLSSIPEAVASRSAIPLRTPSMTRAPGAKEREREREREKEREREREKARQARIAQRLAATPTPAAAYAANLRPGRAPSIAQVLEKDKDR
ncbi:hypothetical protein HDZ31DRAFT_29976 [Schizophyllum fasciatum]